MIATFFPESPATFALFFQSPLSPSAAYLLSAQMEIGSFTSLLRHASSQG